MVNKFKNGVKNMICQK